MPDHDIAAVTIAPGWLPFGLDDSTSSSCPTCRYLTVTAGLGAKGEGVMYIYRFPRGGADEDTDGPEGSGAARP
jgi:hypothetical protein